MRRPKLDEEYKSGMKISEIERVFDRATADTEIRDHDEKETEKNPAVYCKSEAAFMCSARLVYHKRVVLPVVWNRDIF